VQRLKEAICCWLLRRRSTHLWLLLGILTWCTLGDSSDAEHVLDLLCRQVFRSAEHITLRASFSSELMDLHHLSESDETNESVWWQQAQGHRQRILQGGKFFFVHASVDDKQEDWRHARSARNGVFNSTESWDQLSWLMLLGDGGILWRELKRENCITFIIKILENSLSLTGFLWKQKLQTHNFAR
jgi:hypothetical protein